MSSDYFELGSGPWEEQVAQTTEDNYRDQAIEECNVWIKQIRRQFGPEPRGASLIVKEFPHDTAGVYYEVVVCHSDDVGLEYALKIEKDAASRWDDEARTELGL